MADYLIVYVVKYMYTTFYDVDSNEIVVETKVLTLINNVRIKVLSCLTRGDFVPHGPQHHVGVMFACASCELM